MPLRTIAYTQHSAEPVRDHNHTTKWVECDVYDNGKARMNEYCSVESRKKFLLVYYLYNIYSYILLRSGIEDKFFV